MKYFLGCSCGKRTEVDTQETRSEIRCPGCHRYLKVPSSTQVSQKLITKQLVVQSQKKMVGKILGKRFRLDAYLAGGGMGQVYKATDLALERMVAIKVLKPLLGNPTRLQQRFLQEARIASELVHPSIVMTRSFHRSRKGNYFMVMDFCPGRSLRSILHREGPQSVDHALEIGRQILGALQVAHEKGVIHRDIKPSNIMLEEVEEELVIKILDFGIAKMYSASGDSQYPSLTRTGHVMGSTKYLAPEQVEGTKVYATTDLYTVGVLIYQMISGAPPFQGSKEKVLHAVLHKPPLSLKNACKDKAKDVKISWLLDTVIFKALAKRPEDRFRSAEKFCETLAYCQFPSKMPLWQKLAWGWFYLRLHLQKRVLIVAVGIVVATLFAIFYLSWQRHARYLALKQEAQRHLQNQKYQLAYQSLQKARQYRDDPAVEGLAETILVEMFIDNCRQQDYQQARATLAVIKEEVKASFAISLLAEFLEEEARLAQLEIMIANRQYQRAWEFSRQKTSPQLKIFRPRSERQAWLQQILTTEER